MKTKTKLLALLLVVATPMFLSCGKHDPYAFDGINWDGSNSGTLEMVNGSNKDMILFVGKIPANSNMLGGVRAGATQKLDISGQVADFDVGGYAVVRGISKDEYDKNIDLANAKIEYTALVTYRSGQLFRYNIDPNYMGNNGFKVTNRLNIGVELRESTPEGRKIAYLPRLATEQMIYTDKRDAVTLFPVYVFYNRTTGEVSTLEASDIFQSVTVLPEQLGPTTSGVSNYYVPNDASLTWADIIGTLKQPVAYVTVVSNIANQAGYVTRSTSTRLIDQNGDNAIGSGKQSVFEVTSTEEGAEIELAAVYYGGSIIVPFLDKDGNVIPIRNGYNYTVTVSYDPRYSGGGGLQTKENYKATIIEGSKRDVSKDIVSP